MADILLFNKSASPKTNPHRGILPARIDHLADIAPAARSEITQHHFERALEDDCAPILSDLTEWLSGIHPVSQQGRSLRSYLKMDLLGSSLDFRVLPGLHGLALLGVSTVVLESEYQVVRSEMRSLAVDAQVPYTGQPKQVRKMMDGQLAAKARLLMIRAARVVLDALEAGRFEYRLTARTRVIVALAER